MDKVSLTPQNIAYKLRDLCCNHVHTLTDCDPKKWHQHVYRIFYYDAYPFSGQAHHPITNQQINFGKSERAKRQYEIFDCLKKERSLALRLGYVGKLNDWTLSGPILKKLLRSTEFIRFISSIKPNNDGSITIPCDEYNAILPNLAYWEQLEDWMVKMDLRQKGVDMRVGLDIASLTLKKLVKTIVLVAGDSDFVPAAKLARREGVQFILDPLWHNVSDDLFEHIDGLHSGLSRSGSRRTMKNKRFEQ